MDRIFVAGLGKELSAADGMNVGAKMRLDEDRKSEEGDVVEYPDWVDMKMWHPVTQQTALEQAIEACEYLPMESRDLRTFDDITNKIGDVKACTTSLELEGLTSDIRAQFTLISQLNNSCKSAISELKSTISKRKNQKQKQEDDRKSKQAQEEKRANKEKEELERKRLGKVKKVSAFALPFQSIGFPLLQTFLDDDRRPELMAGKPRRRERVPSFARLSRPPRRLPEAPGPSDGGPKVRS